MNYIYKNELDNACFAHDTAYCNSANLAKRTFSDNILKDRPYEFAITPEHAGYQSGLATMVYKVFDKKIRYRAIATSKMGANANEMLAQELHKPVIKNLKTKKVYSNFKDNVWAADIAEKGSLSSKNRGVLLCETNYLTKYA